VKKIISALILCLMLLGFSQPTFAVDLESGAKIFKANCAVCHANGRNSVVAAKTLKKEALEKYGMYSIDAIITQVTMGKNAMPAFASKKLSPDQIENVASYVLAQADAGWVKK
jgi:cytochrome c6